MNETSCNFYTTTYRGCIESLDWFNCDAQTIKTWDYHPKSIYRKTNINIWKGVEYRGPKNDGGLQRVRKKILSGIPTVFHTLLRSVTLIHRLMCYSNIQFAFLFTVTIIYVKNITFIFSYISKILFDIF